MIALEATALTPIANLKWKYPLPRLRVYIVNENQAPPELFTIRCADDVADFLEPIRNFAEEHFISLHLNSKNEVIGLHEVSHGTLSSSLVHPREVFKAALLANSQSIIVCHNHPSGSPITPSEEDLQTTKQLLQAGKIMGVHVLDHVILSPVHNLYSLRDNAPELWTDDLSPPPPTKPRKRLPTTRVLNPC